MQSFFYSCDELWHDIYSCGTGRTADEVWEEIICDSLGDTNIFTEQTKAETAQKLLEKTKAAAQDVRKAGDTRAPPSEAKFSEDFEFDGNVYSARGLKLNSKEKAAISSAVMSGNAHIDAETLSGNVITEDFQYFFYTFSDGSIQVTDKVSNEKMNKIIMETREEKKRATRRKTEAGVLPRSVRTRSNGGAGDNNVRRDDAARRVRDRDELHEGKPGSDSTRNSNAPEGVSGVRQVNQKFSEDLPNLAELKRENKKLQTQVDNLRKQLKPGTRLARTDDINRLANRLIKSNGAELKASDIAPRLKTLADYIIKNGDGEGIAWETVRDQLCSS